MNACVKIKVDKLNSLNFIIFDQISPHSYLISDTKSIIQSHFIHSKSTKLNFLYTSDYLVKFYTFRFSVVHDFAVFKQ